MNIRTKMISLLGLLFAVLIVLDIAIQKQVLMPSFAELERDDAKTSMRRVNYALDMALDNLQLAAVDWGNWADVYKFVEFPSKDFVAANITTVAMKQLQINTLLIVNLTGDLVLASSRELDSGAPLRLDFADRPALPVDFPWRHNLAAGLTAKGLILTNRGIMMIAAAPVLDGSGGGLPRGMVVMGKLLTPREVHKIGAQAQIDVSLIRQVNGVSQQAVQMQAAPQATQVYRSFSDVYGRPLMTLGVEISRKITARGYRAVVYSSVFLSVVGACALLLLVVVLNRTVLAPLARVTRHAVAMGGESDLTERLALTGSDEIAILAREFDRMVERVAQSHQQLIDQSFQSGFAELAKGVLHNLGNAMTPLGVRLAKLDQRLRAAPLCDVELAARELAHEPPGTSRHSDLSEFLRLGISELVTDMKDTQADVAVIQRQAAIVQTALAELMRSTRNSHVLESVRLPELMAQTLEIVPDACRLRLKVETDESLRRIGVVHVARTVLRLVLQNLIINAADAVRDAGNERGVLRVTAEIVHQNDSSQLHLRCDDNGVGIPENDLQRVFEHGFSTKSQDAHGGIGLHWCANAIAAVGGRIWAVSNGPGLGASMHLVLPVTSRENRSTS